MDFKEFLCYNISSYVSYLNSLIGAEEDITMNRLLGVFFDSNSEEDRKKKEKRRVRAKVLRINSEYWKVFNSEKDQEDEFNFLIDEKGNIYTCNLLTSSNFKKITDVTRFETNSNEDILVIEGVDKVLGENQKVLLVVKIKKQ